ncbi:MAG: hypothetical protein ACYCYA_09290 [Actinomycetes bacterium]
MTRDLERLEDLVTEIILARLGRPDAADLIRPPTEDPAKAARDEAATLRRRLDDAAIAFTEGTITRAQMVTITARLAPRVEALEAVAHPPARAAGALHDLIDAEDLRATWEHLDVRQRRDVIGLLVTVRVLPTASGRGFNPEHVELAWKTG